MTSRQVRTPPPDLGDDGRALFAAVDAWLTEHALRMDPHELTLLAELCRQADRLATCRTAMANLAPTEPAWTRLAVEERLGRIAFGRIISQLGLPTGAVPDADASGRVVGLSPSSRRGLKAARARWSNSNAS